MPLPRWLTLLGFTALLAPLDGAWALNVPTVIEGKSLLAVTTDVRVETQAQTTVVVFVSSKCPCSNSHEETLKTLSQEFKSARFVAIHSNADESVEEAAQHFSKTAFGFPIIQDTGAKLADQFGALKTPHAYVIGKDGKILFQGGIDDSHVATNATHSYLKTALMAVANGKEPEVKQARALGCQIRR